jgi:hypothetical protein
MFNRRSARRLARESAAATAANEQALIDLVRRNVEDDGGLTETGIEELKSQLRASGQLTGLKLDGNHLPPEVHGALAVGMARTGHFNNFSGRAILGLGEPGRFVVGALLMREVRTREYRGASQGVSIPLGHGVRFRTSAIRGQLVTVGQHWEEADEGQLTLSDRRILFTGTRTTVEFQLAKLASVGLFSNGVSIGVTNRQNNRTFKIHLPMVFAQMVRASMEAGLESHQTKPVHQQTANALAPAITTTASVYSRPSQPSSGREVTAKTNERWTELLAGSRSKSWLGDLLAEHPEAAEKTQSLLRDLSVRRLVLLANVQHNKCRTDAIPALSGGPRERATVQAWDALLHGMANMSMRENTAWTGTIKLLTPDAEPALKQIKEMQIGEVMCVCKRLIQVPYLEARQRGVT